MNMQSFDVLSFHPGRQHNIEQAFQIQKHCNRFKHITSFYFDSRTVRRAEGISTQISNGLKKRSGELEGKLVDVNPLPEVALLLKRKFGYQLGYRDFLKRNEAFQNWIVKQYRAPKICIGFDTSSWLVFEKWKKESFLMLDLSVAVPQYKLTLAKKYGMNEALVQNQVKDDEVIYEIYTREIEMADLVLCGSSFVKSSCLALGINEEKLCVLPYGVDLAKFQSPAKGEKDAGVIRVVFIGSVIYRKGADVLLQVWERIANRFANVELHFYGNVQMPLPKACKNVFFHGFVDQNTLISEVGKSHISVLPTFFEGSSLAVYQSMALGLAMITTPNAGSVVEDKRNGLLVDYGDYHQLYESLALLITDAAYRQALAANAVADIQQYTWDEYGRKISQVIREKLSTLAGGHLNHSPSNV